MLMSNRVIKKFNATIQTNQERYLSFRQPVPSIGKRRNSAVVVKHISLIMEISKPNISPTTVYINSIYSIQTPRTKYPAPNIQHPTSSTKHPHPTSSTQHIKDSTQQCCHPLLDKGSHKRKTCCINYFK